MATPSTATMRHLQAKGQAMPPLKAGGRPRFNIKTAADLDNAIRAVGRVAPEGRSAVRRYVMKRAAQMKLSSRIPDTWASGGSLKNSG